MKRTLFTLALAGTTLIGAQAMAQDTNNRTVTLENTAGETVGTVVITAAKQGGVLIQLDAENLPEGAHGFHIHEKADCSPQETFKNAGSHFGGDDDHDVMHGYLVTDDPHAGDMPNIHVHEDGTVKVDVFNEDVSLGGEDEGNLLDSDGSAIMIHGNPDDYMDMSSAGPRIACGELKD